MESSSSAEAVAALMHQVKELREELERMRADEQKFRSIFESSPDAMVLSDERGRIVLVNAQTERMLGYSREELVGQQIEMLMPVHARPGHAAERERYSQAPRNRPMGAGTELSAARKDGSELPVEISLSPMATDEGVMVLSAIRDVSERRKAQAELRALNETLEARVAERTAAADQRTRELERSNAELEQFAYVASHDLQEPLRMVSSYVQLLARRYKGKLDSDADEFISFAVDGAARMQQLIQDLLVFSRIGTRGRPFEPTDCNEVVQVTLQNLQVAIREANAQVHCETLPTVMADRMQLVQLFQNLIGNAIKFRGPEPPQVSLGAKRHDDGWLFHVRDNGIGIAPEYAQRIFVIFQRLHGRGEYPGTGIGLALCRKIVERHGGRIWVESQPGAGSTFLFTLPDAAQGADHVQAHA